MSETEINEIMHTIHSLPPNIAHQYTLMQKNAAHGFNTGRHQHNLKQLFALINKVIQKYDNWDEIQRFNGEEVD